MASRTGGADGVKVGVHIGAAERIDRLLGVTDEHKPGASGTGGAVTGRRAEAEGLFEYLPLDRVGVLELVDQDDRVAPAEPSAGRRSSAGMA